MRVGKAAADNDHTTSTRVESWHYRVPTSCPDLCLPPSQCGWELVTTSGLHTRNPGLQSLIPSPEARGLLRGSAGMADCCSHETVPHWQLPLTEGWQPISGKCLQCRLTMSSEGLRRHTALLRSCSRGAHGLVTRHVIKLTCLGCCAGS